MAAAPGPAGAGPPWPGPGSARGSGAAAREDARVRCGSQHAVAELVAQCAPFVQALARGLPALPADALWTFEAALRENISIREQPCEEAAGAGGLLSDSNIKILEDQFDELIVETARKRKQWPKKILMHAVQTMKEEQELLKLYQPVVTPEEIRSPPSQDAYMAELKQLTETASKQISDIMKSFPALIERAEGFSQVLTWQPTLELCRLRQNVSAGCKVKGEDKAENALPPAEVTPTNTDTNKDTFHFLRRKRTAHPTQARRYPLRRRKIALST